MKDLVKGDKLERKPEASKSDYIKVTFDSYDAGGAHFYSLEAPTYPLSLSNYRKVETGLEDLGKLVFKEGNKVKAIKAGGMDKWKYSKGDVLKVTTEINEYEFKSGTWYYDSKDFELIKDTKIPPCVHQSPEEKEEVAQEIVKESPLSRVFESGAMRDADLGKEDYVESISWLALSRYARYMKTQEGKYPPGNWRKGIPIKEYEKSLMRHLQKYLSNKYDGTSIEPEIDHLGAAMFNLSGLMHELEKLK